ncbi:MAG: hypothetical protein M0Z68_04280 [Gammaproteobacteria bacterium]|nr:hypothetical protein [Gammaproteobacteria bacterium]
MTWVLLILTTAARFSRTMWAKSGKRAAHAALPAVITMNQTDSIILRAIMTIL